MATAALNVVSNRGLLDLLIHALPERGRVTELYRRLLAANELAASMNAAKDADLLQSCIATYFQDWMPDISTRLCILDGDSYRRSRLSGPNIFSEEGNFRMAGCATGAALKSGVPLWIPDVRADRDAETSETHADRTPGSMIVLPLAAAGRVVGALEIISDQPGRLDEIDYHMGILVAAHVSCAIENLLTKQELANANARLRDHDVRLTQLNLQLQQLAHTDETTGLFNKRRLFEQLQAEIARARRYGEILSCLMLDIDGFKQVNDTLGHQAGDEVLSQIGSLLRRSLRATDFVARYGGEEFTVLLPHTDASGACRAAENLRNTTKLHAFVLPSARVHLTISIGIACCTKFDKLDAQQIILRADNALYRAKRSGRDRVCVSEEMEVEPGAVKNLSTS